LSASVCRATKQEELLKAMWSLATPDERKALAALVLKWFDQELEEMTTNEVNIRLELDLQAEGDSLPPNKRLFALGPNGR